jgi:hypothetical protein
MALPGADPPSGYKVVRFRTGTAALQVPTRLLGFVTHFREDLVLRASAVLEEAAPIRALMRSCGCQERYSTANRHEHGA